MKKGQIVTATVDRVDFPNKGRLLTEDGERLMVKNVVPGQSLSVMVTKKRSGSAEGRVMEILEESPLEMDKRAGAPDDICSMAGICGGCLYQTIFYDDQLMIKDGQVREMFRPVLDGRTSYGECLDDEVVRDDSEESVFDQVYEGIKASPLVHAYRNKMEFSFGDEVKDGPLMLGLHKRGSFYDICDVSDCRIISDDIRCALVMTRDYFRTLGIPYLKKNHVGYLRHLLVRRSEHSGEILIDLVTSSQRECLQNGGKSDCEGVLDASNGLLKDLEDNLLLGWKSMLLEALERVGVPVDKVTILHTVNDREADVVEDQGTDILHGLGYITEEVLGLKFKITPFSFFQTNPLGAEVLYSVARDYILDGKDKAGDVVYDLYSGTGTIAQLMSPAAKKVVGVEIVEEAVVAARENAGLNGVTNCEFIAGDVLKVLDDIAEKPDYIILDPPRDGVHPTALRKIIDYGVDSLIYISCKPTSLARDLPVFMELGYKVTRLSAVDMFPWTGNVEVIAKIQKV